LGGKEYKAKMSSIQYACYFISLAFVICVTAAFGPSSYTAELIKYVTAVIGFSALIWGVDAIRKEFLLRGVDAAVGFLARLTASLKNLKRVSYYPGTYPDDPSTAKAERSVFVSFCDERERDDFIGKANPSFSGVRKANAAPEDNEDWKLFEVSATKTLELFEVSDGQLPLSKKMFDNFRDLYMLLQDMLAHKKENMQMKRHTLHCINGVPDEYIGSESSVRDEMAGFVMLINAIITEADEKTERLLGEMWKELDSNH